MESTIRLPNFSSGIRPRDSSPRGLASTITPRPEMVACAKAVYKRLPCELRDLVYEYLWILEVGRRENRDSVVYWVRYDAIHCFAAPTVVGKEFAREAWQWLYEHGDFGTKVPHKGLDFDLHGDRYGVGIKPADCKLQSINVTIELRSLEADDPMPNEVRDKFDPLLQIKLIDSFVLTIYMVVHFSQDIDILKLLAVSKQARGVVEKFDKKGVEVSVVFDFQHEHWFWTHNQHMAAEYREQDRFWDLSRAVNRGPLDFSRMHTETVPVGTVLNFSVQGEKAEEMLRADKERGP